jgi:Domain of unknown function (DUF4184)
MPFTPSHVAAVLPFVRTPLLPAALVIGSMGPDLFFYIPLPISRADTHSWLGVVTIDLFFGVLVFVLWQLMFRAPIVDFLPLPARMRIAAMPWSGIRPLGMSWFRLVVVLVISVLLGTVSHVVWDDFTHDDWLTQHLPALQHDWGSKPIYRWLQYASSLFGAVAVGLWALAWWRRTYPAAPVPTRITAATRAMAWVTVVAVGAVASLAIWIPGIFAGASPVDDVLVFRTVTVGIGSSGLAALIWCVAWRLLPAIRAARRSAVPR